MSADHQTSHTSRRRNFLKTSAAGMLALAFSRLPVMAGPFTREDFDHLVPADKKLSPEWLKSLFARGTPERLSGDELKFIGMPIGGIGAGQLYLGGDGRLWLWDVFNITEKTGGWRYAKPRTPSSPLVQSFSLRTRSGGKIQNRKLQQGEWSDVSFRGEYPIGSVEYADAASPVTVKLEAFSPFIPLHTDDSGLPVTIFEFTLRNTSAAPVDTTLSGELENGVCINHRDQGGVLRNRVFQKTGLTTLLYSAEKSASAPIRRSDVVFEDWSKEGYDGWKVEGSAFGSGPVKTSNVQSYQGEVGGDTARVVNSHSTAAGDSAPAKDRATGKLIGRDFIIERDFITFWIGGGKARPDSNLGLSLFVEGKPVHTAAGQDKNPMESMHFDVRAHAGKTARLEIIDDASGSWGNVGVGKIVFTDQIADAGPLEELPDFGTMALALLGEAADSSSDDATAPFTEKLVGSLGRNIELKPGASVKVTFVLAWHFPNLTLPKLGRVGRHYATRFSSAGEVVTYVENHYTRLEAQTKLWRDNWYDSTLPFWFLDRTMLNTSTLASSTCHRFADGRFYGWEGVGCCAGTCGHVYHYAHAIARLFPDLERDVRERVDFGFALQPDGAIRFRGELNKTPALDAQAGTVLRALREHQMSVDTEFLKRNWPQIKRATQWMIHKDVNNDGLIESNQHNTLDSDWFGPVAWLSGLYLASLAAAAQMADEVGDEAFAVECRKIFSAGQKNFVARLFDGDYFINEVDPKHPDSINSGTGCEIDQVFGQSWAYQVGLPRVLPEKETVTALKSLWRYNFSPDVGPYRAANQPGRWFAMAGEAGLLMCTFPRRDWDFKRAAGTGRGVFAGYFNECMNGFEYQVAGHMIWEGMVMEGLAVTRAVHDRYHASRRNPWNEIECGDHYARSMASYGVYLAACGFTYHGPKAHIGFAPKLTPERFKCAFTSSEGWGSFGQETTNGRFVAEIAVRWGKLILKSIALDHTSAGGGDVSLAGNPVAAEWQREGKTILLTLREAVEILAGQKIEISLT